MNREYSIIVIKKKIISSSKINIEKNYTTIGAPKFSLIFASISGSLKCVTALTIALARTCGFLLLKMPEPTKQPSTPSCIKSAQSAGVARKMKFEYHI